MQEFSFNSAPFINNLQSYVPKLAELSNFETTLDNGVYTVTMKDPLDAVFMSEHPIAVDYSQLHPGYAVKINTGKVKFGEITVHIALVNVEEDRGFWMQVEFVTPHPNQAKPIYFLGTMSDRQVKYFLMKVMFFSLVQYPDDLKNKPMGFLHQAYFDQLIDEKDYTRFVKQLILNGSGMTHYDSYTLNTRAKFVLGMSNLKCYHQHENILNMLESFIHVMQNGHTTKDEPISDRYDVVMVLNILHLTDMISELTGGAIKLSPFGEFVLELFEPKETQAHIPQIE